MFIRAQANFTRARLGLARVWLRHLLLTYLSDTNHIVVVLYIEKGDFPLRDSVKYLIISALRYLVIPFTMSTWSGTTSLLRALEAEWNQDS